MIGILTSFTGCWGTATSTSDITYDLRGPTVVTSPSGVILLMSAAEPPPKDQKGSSVTYTFPELSTDTLLGKRNDAAVPLPAALPTFLEPARVVTVPDGVIVRIL